MTALPECRTLLLRRDGTTLHVTLNRPQRRNAMSVEMIAELESVADAVDADDSLRCVVLRGAGGHFCSGGDVADMAAARAEQPADGSDPLARVNRRFGAVVTRFDRTPRAVVAVLEGAVMGGGFGLACVADVAIARADARFGLPETGLGLPPAQIAPFLVQRLGASRARQLALTGGSIDGREAFEIGLVHRVCDDVESLEKTLADVLARIDRGAPGAIAATKRLIRSVGAVEHEKLLDDAAVAFAAAARGPEGVEGMSAFLERRSPAWSRSGR